MPKSRHRNRKPYPTTAAAPAVTAAPVLAPEAVGGGIPILEPSAPESIVIERDAAASQGATLRSLAEGLTLEAGAYIVIGLVALLLRLVNLDARPLSPAEAQTASAAWQFVSGNQPGAFVNPLHFTLDWLAFMLFGGFDLTARFLPALLSVLPVFIPLLARKSLGRTGAVVAALLIALSPTMVFFGRSLAGEELAVGAALASLLLYWNYREGAPVSRLYLAAFLAAVALTAGSAGYTILVPGAIYLALTAFAARRNRSESESADSNADTRIWHNVNVRAALVFAATYLLIATTFLLNRDGLGVAFNLLGSWVGALASVGPFTTPLTLLMIYEPLTLVFGAAGLVLSFMLLFQDKKPLGVLQLLSVLALFALVWYSIAGSKSPSNMLAVSLPLMLLAGWFIGNLAVRAHDDIQASGGLRTLPVGEIPVLAMLMVLVALIYLQIVTFLQQSRFSTALDQMYRLLSGNSTDLSILAASITLALITLLLLVIFVGLSIFLIGSARTVTLLAFTVLIVLGLGMLRATWQLNFTAGDPLREPAVGAQTPLQIRDLVRDLEWYSQWRDGDEHEMQIAADPALGAVARWYLRNFKNVEWTANRDGETDAEAVISSASTPPPGDWQGERYQYQGVWQPDNLTGLDLWKWFVFRQGGSTNWETTMLWLATKQE